MRILYVEDEKILADAVIHLLKKANIDVDWASDGEKALDMAIEPFYDCIVLDIMLPKISGLEVLEIIRKKGIKTPVIMLSALSEVEDKIRGLDGGADDYLAKPFKTAELIARIRALTRRPPNLTDQILTFGDIKFDPLNRMLNTLPLTEKESSILELLIKQKGKTVKKEYILANIWGGSAISDDNYVEVYISYLRRKLNKLQLKTEIKTIRNLGYKLEYKDVQKTTQ